MDDRETFYRASREADLNSVAQWLRQWWQVNDPAEQYLVAATDLADLERRIRVLERASGGPVFVTFNH